MGKKYAIKYSDLEAGVYRSEDFYHPAMGNGVKCLPICYFPKDEKFDSLYTIVESVGDGVYRDTITGVLYTVRPFIHPTDKSGYYVGSSSSNGGFGDEPDASIEELDPNAPVIGLNYRYERVSKDNNNMNWISPLQKVTPAILAETLKTRSAARQVTERLRSFESMVREEDRKYIQGLSEAEGKSL